MMISYRVKYQVRRKDGLSTPQGEWQDKEEVVVAGEDAREAINAVMHNVPNHHNCFRLIGVKVKGKIDVIAQGLS